MRFNPGYTHLCSKIYHTTIDINMLMFICLLPLVVFLLVLVYNHLYKHCDLLRVICIYIQHYLIYQ